MRTLRSLLLSSRLAVLVATATVTAFATAASADPIGGPGSSCDTCQGAVYTLSYSGVALPDADPLNETFRITLTIDTSTLALPGAVAIDAAAIKAASSASASLFDAPGGVGDWQLVPGGIAAAGCSGSGSGFSCADWIAGGVGTPVGGTVAFTFDYTVGNGKLSTDAGEASVKVRYVDANGRKIGDLVSEAITLQPPAVPEPGAALAFALGVALVAPQLRRARRA